MTKTYTQDEVDLMLAKREAELYKGFMEDLKAIVEKVSGAKEKSNPSTGYYKTITSPGSSIDFDPSYFTNSLNDTKTLDKP